jgi:hypothetical protein
MLICFGTLFPPLALIIAISVLKDLVDIKLALGRYCKIMEIVEDESLKNQMMKLKMTIDTEMLKAGAGVWNGVWYGMVIGTWIWGFVLFDTMASKEGTAKGLCVLIAMVACPFIFQFVLQIAMHCHILSSKEKYEEDEINRFMETSRMSSMVVNSIVGVVTYHNPIYNVTSKRTVIYEKDEVEMTTGSNIDEKRSNR